MDEILDVTLRVTATLERLGIPYLVGGSLASSFHGIPRSTQDADVVVRIDEDDVPNLVAAFEEEFYVDEEAALEAVDLGRSFNIIHLETLFKVDLFVAGHDEASSEQMRRRRRVTLFEDPTREFVVASPEDVIAHKLYWYELGGEVAERQWSDALGVLRVGGDRLDVAYLLRITKLRGVEHLLRRACAEAEVLLELEVPGEDE